MEFFLLHGNLIDTIKSLGYIGASLMIFTESGLFFGFFFPGDSLLFTAGLLASQGFFNIYVLTTLLVTAAILGDIVGYWFGKKLGSTLLVREDTFFLRKAHIKKAQLFYEKYGPKAVVLGRFMPVVRTFVPILAGVAKMEYSTFMKYNFVGGFIWIIGLTVAGYVLGRSVEDIDTYLLPIILFIIFISFSPLIFEYFRSKRVSGK
jgi:membrane-associated protein